MTGEGGDSGSTSSLIQFLNFFAILPHPHPSKAPIEGYNGWCFEGILVSHIMTRSNLYCWFRGKKGKQIREVTNMVTSRPARLCNFLEWRDMKIVYKRLYFIMCVEKRDNELITLETVHHFVEILDRYFGNVCELDLIFNFHRAYHILDDLLIAGELQESSKKAVLRMIASQDALQENPEEAKVEL